MLHYLRRYGCNHDAHAYGCQALGLLIDGLGVDDIVHVNALDGRLVVSDSRDATVLVNFHIQGGSAVQAPTPRPQENQPDLGFVGELVRAESFNRFDIQVNNSMGYIVSDFYSEQTFQYMLLGGTSEDTAEGRVTVGGVKIGTNQYRWDDDLDQVPVMVVEGFKGTLVHTGGHFQFANAQAGIPGGNTSKVPMPTLTQSGDAEVRERHRTKYLISHYKQCLLPPPPPSHHNLISGTHLI